MQVCVLGVLFYINDTIWPYINMFHQIPWPWNDNVWFLEFLVLWLSSSCWEISVSILYWVCKMLFTNDNDIMKSRCLYHMYVKEIIWLLQSGRSNSKNRTTTSLVNPSWSPRPGRSCLVNQVWSTQSGYQLAVAKKESTIA